MTEPRGFCVTRGGVSEDAASGFHTQLTHAASRLARDFETRNDLPDGAELQVTVSERHAAALGEEGYSIHSVSPTRIEIAANTDAGAANGIYGFLMALRTKQVASPFSLEWDVSETPRWPDRRVAVASYAMGMTKMTPETWALDEWKAYIDFVRGFNVNRMTILGLFPYHPDLPSTEKAEWRMRVQKQAIAYAHEHGMKVNLMTTYNQVPTQEFWNHPELRTDAVRGYFGLALCWPKAKDLIMKYHRYSLDYLEGLDGIEIMVTEPLGWCLCDRCRPDMAAVWVDAVRELGGALRERNPEGEIVFWNWLSGFLTALEGVYPPTRAIENLSRIQDTLLRDLPSDVVFLDLSRNQIMKDQEFGPLLQHPHSIEILDVAPQRGFEARNFFFYMDKEFGMLDRLGLFPKPFLDRTVDEFAYSKGLPISGVCSYRLAPPGRFLSDFFFMRMAWNPDITRDDAVEEAAGYLTSNERDRRTIAEGIVGIEAYWRERNRDDLLAARDAFVAVCGHDAGEELVRIRDGLAILAMIDDYARSARQTEEAINASQRVVELMRVKEEKLLEVYEKLKGYPIYQGLTTEGIWEPRTIAMHLRPRMELWANTINHKGYDE